MLPTELGDGLSQPCRKVGGPGCCCSQTGGLFWPDEHWVSTGPSFYGCYSHVCHWINLLWVSTLMGVTIKLGSMAMIKHHNQKQLWKDNLKLTVLHEGNLGSETNKNLVVWSEAETMERCCLLASSHGWFSLFYYIPQVHLPRDDTAHEQPGSPSTITNSVNAPWVCLQYSLIELFSQLSVLR